ncbi:hypothetical protein [Olivibacter sitiensis]|uniref:hypothetical protein n=1 Tax=Olivibacter sitiensis TaxID=376470 RepID=UPI000409D5F9|nr:hypothetical protein [Olivibacter sitiensis]
MKRLFRFLPFLILFLIQEIVSAQINVNIRVLPPYQSRISEYASRPDLMLLTLTNTGTVTRQVQLTGSITGDNGMAAWVKPGYRSPQPIELAPGQAINLNGNDIAFLFDHNQLEYTGVSRIDFTRGVGLVEGTYQLCIRALDYNTHAPLSPEEPIGCTQLIISNVEPPTIIMPFNEQEVRNRGIQAFPITWSTPPGASPLTQYKVKMVEMIAPRNPNDAMQSATTPPFFEETVPFNTLLYGPAHPQLTPGRQYALMVQAIDPYNTISFRNQGMSEVITFTYGEMPQIVMTDSLAVPEVALVPSCNCAITELPMGNNENRRVRVNSEIQVNHFKMKVTSLTSKKGRAGLSGTGTILLPINGRDVPFVRLKVAFDDLLVTLNRAMQLQMIGGEVTGAIAGDAPPMDLVADSAGLKVLAMSQGQIDTLERYFSANKRKKLSSLENSASSSGLDLPINMDLGDNPIAMTAAYFSPTQSWFDAVAIVSVPDSNTTLRVAFTGGGICMEPQDICGEAELHLAKDIPLTNSGQTLLGGANGSQVFFGSDGLEQRVVLRTGTGDGPPLPIFGPMTALSQPISHIGQMPDCGCKTDVPQGQAANGNVIVGSDIGVNYFSMKVLSVNSSGEGLSGTGTIPLPIIGAAVSQLKLRVVFRDLVVNADMQMMSGEISGVIAGDAMGLIPIADNPEIGAMPLNSDQINQIDQYFNNNANHLLSAMGNSVSSAGFELPLGIDKGPLTIGITKVFFNASQSWMEAVAVMRTPDGGAGSKVAFSGSGICIKASDLCGDATLSLSEDYVVGSTGLSLKGGADGTHIVFNNGGFKQLGVVAEYRFPEGTIMNAATHEEAVISLSATTEEGWHDWIAKVTFPDFYVAGMQSIRFSQGDRGISYDHSDLKNPDGIPPQFASSDPNEVPINTEAKTWQGLYIPQITVYLPEIIKNTGSGAGISILGSSIIIDNNGVTGTIKNSGTILDIGDGSMDGWYASIDNINLEFFKSAFKTSKMTGKMVLPASTDYSNTSNQLDYTATLTTPQNGEGLSYNFTITPKDNLAFNALFMKVNLNSNSEIVASGSSSESLTAKATLFGKLSISNTSDMKVPGIGRVELPGVTFEHLEFMTYAPFINKEQFVVKLSSDAKKVAGFDFNLAVGDGKSKMIELVSAGNSAEVGMIFSGNIDLAGGPISCKADASFMLSSGIKKENGRISWSGVGGRLRDLSFAGGADLGAFKIKGIVKYFNKSSGNNVDEGFVGALQTNIASLLTVNMRARFGTRSDAQGNFNYFDFNAMVDFGQTGITFAPPVPLALYGFGGGIYYNMGLDDKSVPAAANVPTVTKTADMDVVPETYASELDPKEDDNIEQLLENPAGLRLTPKRGEFGLQATILFGLTSRNTLDADATFSMGFKSGGGVDFVRINGNARILTDVSKPLPERNGVSTGAGWLSIDYNFPEKTFHAEIGAALGLPNVENHELIYATGGLVFHSEPGGWYIYAGRPEEYGEPNRVELFKSIFKGTSYFEVGSMVDPMPDIPQKVKDIVGYGNAQTGKLKKPPEVANRGDYKPGSGRGLIFGSHTEFGFDGSFLMFFGTLKAYTGFDLSIKQGITCDNVIGAGGPGGWYAQGQAYLGAQAKIGIQINLFLIKGKFTIFDAGAGAVIRAGLPNPVWIEGAIGAYFKLFDGAISSNFNFRVALGDKCENANADALGGLEIISELRPANQTSTPVPLTVSPIATFNLQMGGDFGNGRRRSGELEFDDYENVDDHGNPRKRFFLFDRSCIMATLDGQDVTQQLRPVDNQGFTFSFGGSDYLEKDTEYTFKIEAKMKERRYLSPTSYTYEIVKQSNGQDAMQDMVTTFKTNMGFTEIPSSEYALTGPLHSHNAVPVQEYGDIMFIEMKRQIRNSDPSTFFEYPAGTTYHARLFKDGQRQGQDIAVRFERARNRLDDGTNTVYNSLGNVIHSDADAHTLIAWDRQELVKSASYTVLLIAKTPGESSGSDAETTLSKREATVSATNVGNIQMSNTFLLRSARFEGDINELSPREKIAGGYAFRTSRYATYQEKLNNLKTTNLYHREANNIVSPSRMKGQNLQAFRGWIPQASDGSYNIRFGMLSNFPVDETLSGELFSKADRASFTSDEIFQPVYEEGQLQRNIRTPRLYNVDRPTGYGDNLKEYIAEQTSIPLQQIKVEYVSPGQPGSRGGMRCHVQGGSEGSFTNKITAIGAQIPTELPQANQATVTESGMIMITVTFTVDQPVMFVSHHGEILDCEYPATPSFTNPIQAGIDRLTQWAVNWGDAGGPGIGGGAPVVPGGGIPRFNSVSAWQAVGGITDAAIGANNVNKQQIQSQVGSALRF